MGDMGGFVAATYMRGIPFVQIPTTLLAMVDSSIGGKTGVDTLTGKNLIGAFHHPVVVFIDPEFLRTLDDRQYLNGFAEIIKTAAIRDGPLFQLLESRARSLVARDDMDLLEQVILRTAANKAFVVSLDNTEQGVRSTLNFGHTVGHAIEALEFPHLLHGECVSIGMVLETRASHYLGHLLHSSTIGRLLRVLQAYKLPIEVPRHLPFSLLLEKMLVDKKNAAGSIRCSILRAIGSCLETPAPVSRDTLRLVLEPSIRFLPSPIGAMSGKVVVPGSKSLSNRVLTLAALGEGSCCIKGLLHADDTQHMLDALEQLGVNMAWNATGDTLVVHGTGGVLTEPRRALYLGNAGTASRFLTSVCTLLPTGKSAVLTGSARLKERPIGDLTAALIKNGTKIDFLEKENYFPFRVHGSNGLEGGEINLAPEVSSQFVSSVLLSAPYSKLPTKLILTGKPVSQPFIEMTVRLMEAFGVKATFADGVFVIGRAKYQNPIEFVVEADASSASYPLAIAAVTGGAVSVLNVGSASLQSDSKFAVDVLRPMGCNVEQTDTTTTVVGPPGGRLKAIDVDMEHLTDAFMTAAVLMSVAEGNSTITGIANQRVKECNRIAAMVTELSKLGITAEELPTGLVIHGRATSSLGATDASIHCYNDHRIAMSFGVLSCAVKGISIQDKECVNKTYPEFWVAMRDSLGATLLPALQKVAPVSNASPTVVIVGMRGSGKSTLGAHAARLLGRQFLDADAEFVRVHGPIAEYVATHGWPAFRAIEYALLFDMVAKHPTECLISTGGGVIETAECAARLANSGLCVVQLVRPIEYIEAVLAADKSRISLGEPLRDVWKRRQPLYHAASKFDFALPGCDSWAAASDCFFQFLNRLLSAAPVSVPEESYFLCLTSGTMEGLKPSLFDGCSAVELRADLLDSQDPDFLRFSIGKLRLATSLPIIFTLRTKDEGGRCDGAPDRIAEAIRVAVRCGCEIVDFQLAWFRNQALHSEIQKLVRCMV